MIGTLGDVVFEASTEKVLTFNGFQRTGDSRIEEHAVIGRKPVPEFVWPSLETVSLSIRLDAALGINPRDEIKKHRDARDAGAILQLTIGGDFLGDWVISKLAEEHRRIDNRGNVLVAEVSLSLLAVPS